MDKYAYDAFCSMTERTIKRLWILCIVMFLAFAVSNGLWIYHESQYVDEETTTIDATQDGAGVNIISGGDAVNVSEGKDN